MTTFATPQPITATVEVAGAQVRVNATDRADTVVTVAPLDAGSRKDVKVAEKTKVDLTGGHLSVKTTVSGAKNGSVAITIDLPAGSNLTAYLAHSQVTATGPLGDGELHLASGRVELDRVAALRAAVASGHVAAGHVAGAAEVDGGAFDIRLGEVGGAARIESSGGHAWIGHAHAGLRLRSAGSDFDVDRADADVTAETAGGGIRIGRLTRGRATLTNASGDIEVGIAEHSTAYVAAKSERGAVRDYVTGHGPGNGSAGEEVTVHARTRHGNVIIRPAAG